ncbi:uncharacterized protein YhjY with autotransporter beta-barrel domain [Roseimicrobium gellanilyticum]|uniref:Uncharacterized protein YhjY with autotransporter beta-barrel domain n=1 Tax=Roseimicrobium gellanilyticum TaxID=748857 RepID=A0A366HMM5_9BACT|nr:autotransporter-associated beta strand repeat-containing protein [Roseimicrobium gellanilyticum]RBP44412.1 uncharacterized protein YhjY with autotransporter beta-barrel domain [Roseimicrobium gellanilyticum]
MNLPPRSAPASIHTSHHERFPFAPALLLLLLVLGSLAPKPVAAADNSWINVGAGAWENGANWSLLAPPQIGDHAIINNGGIANLTTVGNASSITLGTTSVGSLAILDGGVLSVNNGTSLITLASQSGSTGTLFIEGNTNAGVLNASGVHGGAGTAVLNFNHTDAEYYFTKDGTATGAAVVISGSTTVNFFGTGKTILTGVNTHTGGTTVNAGSLQLGNGIDAASLGGKNGNDVLALEDDAFAIGGTGLVGVTINNNGGTFNVLANATVTGGKGGDASIATYGDSMGGSGGAGTIFNGSGTLTNAGTISGGNGGYVSIEIFGDAYSGWGGTGVSFGNSSTLINTVSGIIRGGNGGDGLRDIEGNEDLGPGTMETGDGGAGASFLGVGTLTNAGLISGGNGGFADGGGLDNSWGIGDQNNGYGGDGGVGVMFYNGGTITNANTGIISGGHGGDTDTFRSNGGNTFGLAYAGDGAEGVVLRNGGTITNEGTIKGGNGGSGSGEYGYGGLAAAGVFFRDGGELTNHGSGTIDGGNGGNGMGVYGGRGGAGVEFNGEGALTNSGAIAGGVGGFDIYGVGGSGASGVFFTTIGELTNNNGGTIKGGKGGDGGSPNGGSGAAGVYFTSSGLLTNAGTITGGQGGKGGSGQGFGHSYGGGGGAGVRFTGSGELINSGTISGEDGGLGIGRDSGGSGTGGAGGAGVELASGGTLTNSGTITAGNGGDGTGIGVHAGTGGGGGAGVVFVNGGTLTNTGTISRGAGGIGSTTSGVVGIGVRFSDAAGTLTNGSNSGGGTIHGGVEMADAANAVTLFIGSEIVGGLNMSNNTTTTLTLDGSTGSQLYSAAVTDGTVFNGALIKQGAGTWILDEAWSHSGSTTIEAGLLQVDGSMTSDIEVHNGGALGGSGEITGAITVADGGTLAPGSSPGTLTVDELILSNGSLLDFELGDPAGTAGVDSDLISVESGSGGTGDLVLDGVLNVANAGGFGSGTFRLINYDGDLTNNGLELGNLLAGYNFTLDTSTLGEVNLTADYTGLQFWDGNGPATNGEVNGGSGIWNATNSNWTDGNGNGQNVWSDLTAVFSGTAGGTVEVDGTQTISGLHFSTDGYLLADADNNGAFSLAVGGAEFRIDAGLTATLDVPLTGDGGLSKTGSGTIVLTGVNTFTGGTTVNGGVLQLGNGVDPAALVGRDGTSVLPSTVAVTVNSGATFNTMASATVTGGNGADTAATADGSGSITQAGNGATAIIFTNGAQSNAGTINGGSGGSSTVQVGTGAISGGSMGGNGGTAITFSDAGSLLENTGTVNGGVGGNSLSNLTNDGVGGMTAGGNGGTGLYFDLGGTLTNTGGINGGAGGNGSTAITHSAQGGANWGGTGGAGVVFGALGAVTNDGIITGGAGGSGSHELDVLNASGATMGSATSGGGGVGVVFALGGTLTNNSTGAISGGDGGSPPLTGANGSNVGGDGAAGVSFGAAGTVTNAGAIAGGDGGRGANSTPGAAAAGIDFAAGGTVTNQSSGTITGGNGGSTGAAFGVGKNGAAGVSFGDSGTLTNGGTIVGGNGGASGAFAGGSNGGAGVSFTGGGALTNEGTIAGGNRGGTSGGGAMGSHGVGVSFAGAAGTLINGSASGGGIIQRGVVMGDYANAVTLFTGSEITGDLNMSTNSAVTFTLDGAGTQLYSAAVTGTTTFNGTLIKQGTGTWTLDQNFTHSGNTIIHAGTLAGMNLASSSVTVTGGAFSPGGAGTVLDVTVDSLRLQGGGLLMDLGAGGVSDTIFVDDGLGTLSAPALFSFNNLGGLNSTQMFLLIDGLDPGTPWDLGLLSFSGATGSFLMSEDFTELYFNFYDGSLIGGRIIQNALPTGTPPMANFLVDGAVTTGNPAQSNMVNSLTFHPGSTLQVYNNLRVTSGNFTVTGGSASINGGSVIVPGDFHKNGSGLLVANTFLQVGGASFINQGTMLVNGTLHTSSVHVGSGGVLGGSGLIVGHVINAGLVSPGNSPGTLSIHGNYTQTRTGTLRIEVASPRVFDRLQIRGTARLDGTLDVRNYGGNQFAFGQQVPFLQAGRIVGKFDRILMPQDERFRGRFLNAGHAGILLVAPTSYTLVAHTGNETRVAQALDQWIGIEDGDIGEVTLALDLLTEEHYPAAFAAIMPGYYETALTTAIELSHSQGQLLHQQLSARRLGTRTQSATASATPSQVPAVGGKGAKHVQAPQVAAAYEPRWNAWVLGSGMFSEGGLSLTPGEDFESGTYLAGADYALSEHVSVGLFAGYQEGWSDYDHGGDLDLDSVRFGAYATVDLGGFYAHGVVGGGSTDYDVQRSIRWATLNRSARSDTDGTEFFTMLGTGYDFHAGPFTFGPSLSVQYTKVELDGFTERGAGSLSLDVRDAEEESLRSYLGARVACTFQLSDEVVLIPEVRAFWQHEFMQGGESIHATLDGGNGPAFNYITETPDKDAIYAGVGVNALFGDHFSTSLYYHANFGRNEDAEHTISLNVNWKF